ncbi:hypothetical protein AALP_AAs55560U001100 [Arabis alpina]|uniref:Uncharacterized protein n=1 Tax=Arabis alpina TaxID=50452 RepID=A0A087G3Q7_ARAAL|nr:hypothetical protein AALP_AAs55560U001100 [Arabis alpina]
MGPAKAHTVRKLMRLFQGASSARTLLLSAGASC